jgi:hypothetical protein
MRSHADGAPRLLGGLADQPRAAAELLGNPSITEVGAFFDQSRDLGGNLSAGVLACLL